MAKISAKNIELKDGEKIIFGTGDDAYIVWNGAMEELGVSTTISGVNPTESYHLTTRWYVDQQLSSGYPRYFVASDVYIRVNDFGQYVIHETGYLEIAGTLEFGEGGMLIIV
jgi:hypothetical protein